MTIGIRERSDAYLEAADAARAIDAEDGPEPERLARISDVLTALARRQDLFPAHAFPRASGTPGGLFRLVEYADGHAPLYMSLGFTGRSQAPHRHISWAIVAGVSGGIEANALYAFHPEPGEQAARLEHVASVAVGPGEAIAIETGVFHTIDVRSETPVLHLHAYGVVTDTPGHSLARFDSPEARTYTLRESGGFQPPLAVVNPDEAREDLARSHAALVALGSAPSVNGPLVFDSLAALLDAGLDRALPILVSGDPEVAISAAKDLYANGHPLVFQLAGY